MPGYVKVAGVWELIDTPSVKVAGTFQEADTAYVKVGGAWKVWHTGVPPLAPGQYTLPTTAGGGGSSFVEADTTPYRGRITEVRVLISWDQLISGPSISVTGRPNGNFYRNIVFDQSWSFRSIFHRIDTWDATSLTDFNNGDAIGFTYGGSTGAWSNTQVVLTIV